ncbi:MAG TPA: methionyl-tRNA formyltransferase [Acidimicrobiales bacterium]|nr:methionyl-tRNA formyltransferase [Acidimicrobiales bacterium]
MKLVFLGTPEVAAGTLRALVDAGHDVRLVVTRADVRRGRGPEASPSAVKVAAMELGLPVAYRATDVLGSGAELGVVVAYGRIVKPNVLAETPMVNMHFSLLPRWRGAAPVERAILAGDPETGVCLMGLEEGLDTGPVYARLRTAIGDDETAEELRQRLGHLGNALLLQKLRDGLGDAVPQVGEPTYAAKLEPSELRLDFTKPAEVEGRVIRVGRAWTTWRGKRLLVRRARVLQEDDHLSAQHLSVAQVQGTKVGTSQGVLELLVVQPEGKPAMDAEAWARGARPQPSERLGE